MIAVTKITFAVHNNNRYIPAIKNKYFWNKLMIIFIISLNNILLFILLLLIFKICFL